MQVCKRCLGRRRVGAIGLDIQEGAADPVDGVTVCEPESCQICENAFQHAEVWLQLALDAARPYQYASFQIGTVFPKECEQVEKQLMELIPDLGDSIRTEANRWLAARFAEKTGATTVEGRPDLVIQVDTRFHAANATSTGLFVRGRYTKLRRDVPQTHWPCKTCQGTGCYACDDSGVMYHESVEDAIGVVVGAALGSSDYKFHGAGREDIDALMLGTGRPFILEVLNPVKREADWPAVERALELAKPTTGVCATHLRVVGKEEVAEIKAAEYEKTYLAHCEAAMDVSPEGVQAAATQMSGTVLDQRTPERVSHRRADLVRNRTVHEVTVESVEDNKFTIAVRAESGTYIKEMVSGDDGRTTPSFADLLGVPVRVEFLDVVGILDGEAAE